MAPSAIRTVTVTKAVIPAAGLGTRFLPATKAVPKELLPVVDKPALEYIVEEAARVGLTDVLMITGAARARSRTTSTGCPRSRRRWRRRATPSGSPASGRPASSPRSTSSGRARPRGSATRCSCAAEHVGDEPFAVLLGDDVIDERDPLLETMLAEQQAHGGSVIALMEVPPEQVSLYGVATVEDAESHGAVRGRSGSATWSRSRRGTRRRATSPSSAATCCRRPIFEVLRNTPPGRGGEIQLTDAHQDAGRSREPVHGVVFNGRRYDTGDRGDYLKAIVKSPASGRTSGPDFWAWLQEYVAAAARSAGLDPARARTCRLTARPAEGRDEERRRAPAGGAAHRRAAAAAAAPAGRRARLRAGRGRHRRRRRCRASTTRRWTATPCGWPTSRRPPRRARCTLPVIGDIAAGSRGGMQRPARLLRAAS